MKRSLALPTSVILLLTMNVLLCYPFASVVWLLLQKSTKNAKCPSVYLEESTSGENFSLRHRLICIFHEKQVWFKLLTEVLPFRNMEAIYMERELL